MVHLYKKFQGNRISEKYWIPICGDGLALLGGVLLNFSFAPFNNSALAIVALLLLLLSWLQVSLSKVVWRGYLFGLGQFGTGVYWVYFGIRDLGGTNTVVSAGLTVLLVAYLALYPALVGWITVVYCKNGKTTRLLLVFPAAWTLLEWLRGWFLTGFPWLQLGYSQIDAPLSGFAPIAGVYGVSWLLALTAAAIFSLYHLRSYRCWGLLAVLLCLWCGSQWLRFVNWTQPTGSPFQATLIQGNIPLQRKWLPEQRDDTLDIYTSMTRQHWDSRLIVWPETALPVIYDSLDPQFVYGFNEELTKHRSDILLGVITSGNRANQYFNAMKLWGEMPGVYHKRHLVPFGEYTPLRPASDVIANLVNFAGPEFKSGKKQQRLLTAAGYHFSASICYEDAFGVESLWGLPQAAYLVNISDDGGWGNSSEAHQHLQMARFRALETGRYMLRATATGITAFINEKGKVVSRLERFKRATLTDQVVPMVGSTPYMWWGDALALSVTAFNMILAGLLTYRSKSK